MSFIHSEKDPENNWHEVDIRNLGVIPIFVAAGTRINCLAYPVTDDMRRTYYGDYGRASDRSSIPDQDDIFDI